MKRGRPGISDEAKQTIGEVYLAHPDWTGKEIWNEVNKQLKGKGPAPSTVANELSKLSKGNIELDQPWSLGSVIKYNISPDIVPLLLKLQASNNEKGKALITIREARWIKYLCNVLSIKKMIDYGGDELIISVVSPYCARERVSEVTGIPLNTFDLDRNLSLTGISYLAANYFKDTAKIKNIPESELHYFVELTQKEFPELYEAIGLPNDFPTFKTVQGYLEYLYSLLHEHTKIQNYYPNYVPKSILKQYFTFIQDWIRQNEPEFAGKEIPELENFVREKLGDKINSPALQHSLESWLKSKNNIINDILSKEADNERLNKRKKQG